MQQEPNFGTPHLFIDALQRPDRDDAWLAQKRKQMLQSQFSCEYPMTPEEALAGSSEFVFPKEHVDAAHTPHIQHGRYVCPRHTLARRYDDPYGKCPLCPSKSQFRTCNFAIGWDIGGSGAKADASVGTVLDLTGPVVFILEQHRFVGIPYPALGARIEELHRDYPGALTSIEMSGIGAAVRGNLNIPDSQLVEFWTTQRSKARIIGNVAIALQTQELKYDEKKNPQLRTELLGYMEDDEYCQTDTVMSLAVALDQAGTTPQPGTMLGFVLV